MSNIKTSSNLSLQQKFGDESTRYTMLEEKVQNQLRVCVPASIISINYSEMTCTCQPLIRERIKKADNTYTYIELPLLLDVPIVYPGSSTFSITFPLSVGDEGLVIFSDMCIDAWWQSGGIQNQFEIRRHDLSDGFFIPAQMSQPKKYSSINATNMEIKSRGGTNKVLVDGINVYQLKQDFDALKTAFETFVGTTYANHRHQFSYTWTDGPGSASDYTQQP